ncbi:carboxypeptidase-like regulatory domain-containing protein [Neorhodopirellula pilleata]|uniref:carboxypeptidase-like regulatory domain-containing protein n=1 Tax=Neorhodopirellula pilleata TaxID=2714738 RepID=UPI0011B5A498|nr:carboxypeptidase-like regulatory domain-containing protein [Neorhodopirellula pilleata]
MNRSVPVVSLFLLGSLTLVGCTGEPRPDGMPDLQPLALTVIQQGVPLEGATVQLIADDPNISRWASGGVTNAEGEVSLKTLGQYEGVVPGTYKVTVYKMAIDGDSTTEAVDSPSSGGSAKAFLVVDPKYQAEATTPVKIEVAKGVDTLPAIDIGAAVKITQMPM